MSGKHTPGPWRWLDEATLVGDHGIRPVVITPVRRSLPAFGTRGESGLIEPMSPEHPNARLIAAAPELLEALRATEEALRYAERQLSLVALAPGPAREAKDRCHIAGFNARAAIAKAEEGK